MQQISVINKLTMNYAFCIGIFDKTIEDKK